MAKRVGEGQRGVSKRERERERERERKTEREREREREIGQEKFKREERVSLR